MIHPSSASQFFFALEAPMRIQETGGGSASWDFVRMSLFKRGAETERIELGSDVIAQAGFSNIEARQNRTYGVVLRCNSLDDFDDLRFTLGFSDRRTGRQFTAEVPLSTFAGVDISIIPLAVPSNRIVSR